MNALPHLPGVDLVTNLKAQMRSVLTVPSSLLARASAVIDGC